MPAERAIPMAEPLVWAAHLAAVTTTLKLASGVLVLPQREPVLLAKQAATVAVLSQGRLILGAGTGWLREEFAILGAEFDHRVARMDEHVTAMRALWADDVADFDGTFVSFTGAQISPRPPGGAVPIVVGGDSDAAARRAGRIGDGWFPAKTTTEALPRLLDLAHKAAADAGRDPGRARGHDPRPVPVGPRHGSRRLATWRALGVHRILLSPEHVRSGAARRQPARLRPGGHRPCP